jgi:redox-sensing transcriptional repressor
LRLDRTHKAALVGIGNLGVALLNYAGFALYGFDIVAAFDVDPGKIGKAEQGIVIEDISNLRTLKKRRIRLGIMAVPSSVAQEVAEALVRAGVLGILNFAASPVSVPKSVKVISVDIAASLACLPYHLSA